MPQPNRFAPAPQRLGSARSQVRPRSTVRRPVVARPLTAGKQSGHALVRSAEATDWRIRLKKLGTRLQQTLRHGLGLGPTVRALEEALSASLRQHKALCAELKQAKAELARLRAELAGTQAGERTARHQAQHDGLTGLPNRRMFMAQLQKALGQHTHTHLRPSLMYLDIDDFKRINDEHGHKVGDGVLVTVGARLAKSVRAGDLVARLGGDEFACLLGANLSRAQLLALAKKLCDSVAAPMKLDNVTLHTRVSIGLSRYPDDGNTADTLLDRADAAMYKAKQQRTEVEFASQEGTPAAGAG